MARGIDDHRYVIVFYRTLNVGTTLITSLNIIANECELE